MREILKLNELGEFLDERENYLFKIRFQQILWKYFSEVIFYRQELDKNVQYLLMMEQ